jgi:hypothetical protein
MQYLTPDELEPHSRYGTPPEQNRQIGFDAVTHELVAELVKEGRRKIVVMDFFPVST